MFHSNLNQFPEKSNKKSLHNIKYYLGLKQIKLLLDEGIGDKAFIMKNFMMDLPAHSYCRNLNGFQGY